MKTRTVVILTALVVAAMVVEAKFVASMSAGSAIHNYHGICNVGVGQQYGDFIHRLRTMAENGDTKRLVTVLRRADEHSGEIYRVWLGANAGGDIDTDAYKKSIEQILN